MKLLSITVPCYNSAAYMERCVDSLLKGGEDVEIIIIDDGSSDETALIADEYVFHYPSIVKAIHQENGGHGEAVNAGLREASGIYFKVVDSDDWLDEEAYKKVLVTLRKLVGGGESVDMMIANYVYEKVTENTKKVINYRTALPADRIFTWDEVKYFRQGHYILMHSVIYRTGLLRECGLKLPEHTFYVDNLFAYCPLPYVETIYYMNIALYQYYLGREDQSVNEKVLIARIEQQIKVTKMVAESVDLNAVRRKYPKLANYMCRNISIMMAISSIHLLLINSQEAYSKRRQLWRGIKEENARLYFRLKYTTLSGLTYLPGKVGGMLTKSGYRAARKIYQFQ